MVIKILLADDQFLILEGIKAILEPEPKIEIVGTARDGQTAIAQAKKLRPDILLIDIEMPKMNGILATKYICKYLPSTKVIVLTSHKDRDYLAEALLAGASGYLLKDSLIKDLKQEIYAFGRGYPSIKAKLLTQTVKRNSQTNIVKYREKILYLQKYRKNIYKPSFDHQKQQLSSKTNSIRPVNLGIIQASKPSKQILATSPKTSRPPRFNRRKYRSRIIWLVLAIASIVLSIIIF